MKELSLHILDIAQNSITAGAGLINIIIDEDTAKDTLLITIEDDGKGMPPEMLAKVKDPFVTTRTTRPVGMGISLFEGAAKACGGYLDIQSEVGKGTILKAMFKRSHIDRAPIGDMGETYAFLAGGSAKVDFVYSHTMDGKNFTVDTRELKSILGGAAIDSVEVINWIKDYIKESLINLSEGMEL